MENRITSLGIPRVLTQYDKKDSQRLPQQKFRIHRTQLLEYAEQAFQMCTPSFVLNFEFYGEPGIGSGPTREFYTLFSEEIQAAALNIWLKSEDKPTGLFFFFTSSICYPCGFFCLWASHVGLFSKELGNQ